MFPYKRILLKITGSVAAYKACELISQLKKMGGEVEVQVVLSQRATEFVGKATLQALTGRPAAQGLFEGKDARPDKVAVFLSPCFLAGNWGKNLILLPLP